MSIVELAGSSPPVNGPSDHPAVAWFVRRLVSRLAAHLEAHRRQVDLELASTLERLSGELSTLRSEWEALRGEIVLEAARKASIPFAGAEKRFAALEEQLERVAQQLAARKKAMASLNGLGDLDQMEERLREISNELGHPTPGTP